MDHQAIERRRLNSVATIRGATLAQVRPFLNRLFVREADWSQGQKCPDIATGKSYGALCWVNRGKTLSHRSERFVALHDADAVIALYAEGATYHSPRFDHPPKGQALADFLKSLFKSFPDLWLEVISRGDTGGGLVATRLVLHGTHTGPFMDGTPPTGRTVAYPLASFA